MDDYTVIHYGYVLMEREASVRAESLDAAIEQAQTLDEAPDFYPIALPTIAGWETSWTDWPDGGFRVQREDGEGEVYDSEG